MRGTAIPTIERSADARDRHPSIVAYLAFLALGLTGPAAIYLTVIR
jgi:hypothetical protein